MSPHTIIVYERGFGPMDEDEHVLGVIPLACPDELEAGIAEVIAERLDDMRDRERHDRCKQVEREQARKVLRRYEPWVLSVAMFGIAFACSWIAEQTLARGM